ncbi:MAG: 4Fe-4S dicluster domain-containing protein [Gammaproteobacteria bacterium]|nr:MAG: 4Fe-4S dicluster domain-containing protein [Gammaproteobacteria bacterium]
MGLGIHSDEVPVTKAMNCILVTTSEMTRDEQGEMPCIRCGECTKVCPAHLMPQQLLSHTKANDLEQAQRWHLESCIECGCCNAVCPSHIPLVSYFRHTKSEIRAQGRARNKAQLAKQRHEAREVRLEKAKKEREERLKKKKELLKKSQSLNKKQTPEKADASVKNVEDNLSAKEQKIKENES